MGMGEAIEIERLKQELADKEELILQAAQYGQELLERNNELENSLADMSKVHQSNMNISMELEDKLHESEKEKEVLLEQNQSLKIELKSVNSKLLKQENDIHELKSSLLQAEESIAQVSKKRKLDAEATSMKCLECEKILCIVDEQRERLRECCDKLQEKEGRICELENKDKNSQDTIASQQALIEELKEVEAEFEVKNREVIELTYLLEESRQTCLILTSRFEASLGSEASNSYPASSTSLLSEIEDRKKELETECKKLKDKTQGLTKMHLLSIQEQERLKSRISRLLQVSCSQADKDYITRLESLISQMESEKEEMIHKISALLRENEETKFNFSSLQAEEANEVLIRKCQQLTEKHEKDKQELLNYQIMHLADSRRVRDLEKSLRLLEKKEKEVNMNEKSTAIHSTPQVRNSRQELLQLRRQANAESRANRSEDTCCLQ